MISPTKKIVSNRFLRSYLQVFSVDVLVKGAGIILLPVYLKLMTQEEFGLYGYLTAIISTFSLVFNLGIYAAQSKLYHDYPIEKRGTVLFTLNSILLLFLIFVLTIILLFDLDYSVVHYLFKNPLNYDKYRGSVLLAVVVAVYSLMLTNFFLTSENIKKVQLFNIARIVLINSTVIGILFITSENDHTLVRLKYSNIMEFLIILSFGYFYFSKMKWDFDYGVARRVMKIALPILASAIIGIFVNLSDRYFLEKYGTLRDLSIYTVALTVAGVVPFVFSSFQNIWLPQFLKEKDIESNRLRSRKMVFRLLIMFTLLSAAILVVLKLMLSLNIVDKKYEEIIPLLPIVLAASIVTVITGMFSNHLIYMEKLYYIIIVGVPVSLLGIWLNMQLVPLFNIYGAAVSSLAVNGCFLISYVLLVNHFYGKRLKESNSPISKNEN